MTRLSDIPLQLALSSAVISSNHHRLDVMGGYVLVFVLFSFLS